MSALIFISLGLAAGFFLAWSVTVIPGTKVIGDSEYMKTMIAINRRIKNPVFIILFFGPAILWAILEFSGVSINYDMNKLRLALFTYVVGGIGITMFFNVPLNERLDKYKIETLSNDQIKEIRESYEKRWNFFHYLRTGFSVLSYVILFM